jgi:hypothetical protein
MLPSYTGYDKYGKNSYGYDRYGYDTYGEHPSPHQILFLQLSSCKMSLKQQTDCHPIQTAVMPEYADRQLNPSPLQMVCLVSFSPPVQLCQRHNSKSACRCVQASSLGRFFDLPTTCICVAVAGAAAAVDRLRQGGLPPLWLPQGRL